MRIIKNHANKKSNENHENPRIVSENYENQENNKIPRENRKNQLWKSYNLT